MKKNLLLVLGVTFALGASAQSGLTKYQMYAKKSIQQTDNVGGYHDFSSKEQKNNAFTAKAGGDTLHYEDFSDVAATGWTLDNNGQTDADKGWANLATSRKFMSAIATKINSVSGGNFLEVMNGKLQGNTPMTAKHVTYTATSTSFAIPSRDVTLSFLQYGASFNDRQIVEISVDSTVWIEVYSNDDKTAYVGNNPAAIYSNPDKIDINIGTSGIPANTSQIYVRFKWTANPLIANQEDPWVWLTFGWMIDDLTITENNSLDLKNTGSIVTSAGIRYSIIPTSQKHDVPVGNFLLNNGSSDLSDVRSFMKITTPSTTINDTVNGSATLAAYSTDTVEHAVLLTDEGTYSVSDFGGLFDGVDEIPGNDTNPFSFTFNFGGTIFALDNNTADGYVYENNNDDFKAANLFDIYANVEATGIDVYLYESGNTKSTAGTEIFGSIHDLTISANKPTDTPVETTPLFSIGASDNNKWITLVFENPVQLIKDKTYAVTVGNYGSLAEEGYDLVVGTSGTSLSGSSLVYSKSQSSDAWLRTVGTPMVRLNLTPGIVSTKNLDQSVKANIYPNPAADAVVIDYNTAFDGDVKVSVVDLNGKAVYSNTFANQAAGNNKIELNVNNYTSGVYQVVIEANSSMITKKLVIK